MPDIENERMPQRFRPQVERLLVSQGFVELFVNVKVALK
jgi:hypothetical protein